MPARADLRWSQLKVGILVAVAVAILVFVTFALTGGSSWFSPKLKLVTYVSDAAGMRVGASVNLEGVSIGNVTAIRLAERPPNPATPVEVRMSVAPHERWLRTNSTVQLGTAGPLGATLVNINAGTPAAPPARDGTVLPGQPVAGINTLLASSNTVIENAAVLENKLGEILTGVQGGRGTIGKLLSSDQLYSRFNATALNLEQITGRLNHGQGTVGKLLTDDQLYAKLDATVTNLNDLLEQIRHGRGSLAEMVNNPDLYNHADRLMNNLAATTTRLNQGQGALGALMVNSPASAHLESTLARLDALLAGLQAGRGTVGKLVTDPTLYNNLSHLSASAQALVAAMRKNPKQYLTIHLDLF